MPFLVGVVEGCEPIPNKSNLKKARIDVGSGGDPLTIVTNAPNIREGTRTVVAMVGTEIEGVDGTTVTISKTAVGGVMSEGMVCDSVMLGWSGGAAGICVQIPSSFAPGSAAPSQKPRMDGGTPVVSEEPQKSDNELKVEEKLRKKAELAARREELKAKKAAKKAAGEGEGEAAAAADIEEKEAAEEVSTEKS